jgi:hypothetical protein
LFGKEPCRGEPQRDRALELPATYKLGISIGEQPGGETPLGGKILPEWKSTIARGSSRRKVVTR